MAPRPASTTRLAILTVLVGLATASLAPHAVQRSTATSSGRGGWLSLTLVGILTVPALVLVVLAGVRHRPRRPPRPPATERRSTGKPWLDAMILLSLLAIAITTTILLRPTRSEPNPPPTPDPRTAIIHCYAAMEGALGGVPGAAPHPADSPTEVLDRATATGAVRSPSAWRLVELFDEARFSTHRMTEPDRAAAESTLRL